MEMDKLLHNRRLKKENQELEKCKKKKFLE